MIAKKEKIKPINSKYTYKTLSFFLGNDCDKNKGEMPSNYASESKNFKFDNNKLVATQGWEKLKLRNGNDMEGLENVSGRLFSSKLVYNERNNTLLLYSHNKGLDMRCCRDTQENWIRMKYNGIAESCCYYRYKDKDYAFLSSPMGMYYIVDGGSLSLVLTQKHIKKILSVNERIFAVVKEPNKPNSLWFSDMFNPLEWDVSLGGGGYIDVDFSYGEIREIESIGDYLYIFCDFGICRLTCFAAQENFELKKVCSLPYKMQNNGIGKVKEKIVFATQKQLCIFDGSSYWKLNILLEKYTKDNYIKKMLALDDKIYICMCNDDHSKNMVIVYDLASKSYFEMTGWQIEDIALVEGGMWSGIVGKSWLCNTLVRLSDDTPNFITQVEREWCVRDIDMGLYDTEKIIKEIEYKVTSDCEMVIESNNQEYNFRLLSGENKIKVNVSGKKFCFKILSNMPKVEICPMRVKIGVKNG